MMKASTVLSDLLERFNYGNTTLKEQDFARKPQIGISYPKMEKIASNILAKSPIEFLETNDCSIYEMEILHTMVIGRLKDFETAFNFFKSFAVVAKEWSVVDSLCQRFLIAKKHRWVVYDWLKEYAMADDEYQQRIVAVMLLSHFLVEEFIYPSIEMLIQLDNPGYYCKMAVAWAFATIMAKYPEKGFVVLRSNRLDAWTHNKAIQKTMESFRVSADIKVLVKQLKR